MESTNLGSLFYTIEAKLEDFERQMEEMESKWGERKLRLQFDIDEASINALNERLQQAIQPIRVTLDTSAAEAQLAMMSAGASVGMGGGGFGGGGGSGGGGGMWGNRFSGGMNDAWLGVEAAAPAAAVSLAPYPSTEQMKLLGVDADQQSAWATIREQALLRQAGMGEGATMGAASGGGRGTSFMSGLRLMAGIHFAMTEVENVERVSAADSDLADQAANGGGEIGSLTASLHDIKQQGSGVGGWLRGTIGSQLRMSENAGGFVGGYTRGAEKFLGWATGGDFTADDFDDDSQEKDTEKRIKAAKLRAKHANASLRLDRGILSDDDFVDQLGEARDLATTDDPTTQAIDKIDRNANRQNSAIDRRVATLRGEMSGMSEADRKRATSEITKLESERGVIEQTRIGNLSHLSEAETKQESSFFNFRDAMGLRAQEADAMARNDPLAAKMIGNNASANSAINGIDIKDPHYQEKVDLIRGNEAKDNDRDAETIGRKQMIDQLRTGTTFRDEAKEADLEHSLLGSLGSQGAGAAHDIQRLLDSTLRQDQAFRLSGNIDAAEAIDQRAISQLNLLRGQLTTADSGREADPTLISPNAQNAPIVTELLTRIAAATETVAGRQGSGAVVTP